MHRFAAPASLFVPHSESLRQIWNEPAHVVAQLVGPYASQQIKPGAQSALSSQRTTFPAQLPFGPTHVSLPASPLTRQHDFALVSQLAAPQDTSPGLHAAPPSGAWHVDVGPEPLDPSAVGPPASPTGPPLLPPLLLPPPLLPPVPPSSPPAPEPLLVEPPLLALLPDPLPPPELELPPSGLAVPLSPLPQCASASGAAPEIVTTPTIHTCIDRIGILLASPRPIARSRVLPDVIG